MILRNLIFQLEVIKQRLPAGLVSHHKQQASQCNAEQQHRWAAYNLNPAPAQASTEGLFQQTRLVSSSIHTRERIQPFGVSRYAATLAQCSHVKRGRRE